MRRKAPARRPVTPVQVHCASSDGGSDSGAFVMRPDQLVTEEPMEIRLQGPGGVAEPLAVTMRTPGHDFELAAGFCRTEGLIDRAVDLHDVRYCVGEAGTQEYNVVTVRVRRPVRLPERRRAFVASSSCGLCGAAELDQVMRDVAPVASGPVIGLSTLLALPQRARDAQPVFEATGGLHAAALFDADGTLRLLREDIGRHNALDKLVGHALMHDALPLTDTVVLVSGRVSFEIVQKAAVAGIGVVAALSAPSSLAVAAAARLGQTVVGFLRDGRGNVYTHPERIDARG